MEGNYPLIFGSREVGTVQVTTEGLYYRFRCRCRMSGDVISKVIVACGGTQERLGILVPEGDGFSLNTRLPMKRLGEGKQEFRILPNRETMKGKYVPIKPEEPFSYIERLKDAYLAYRNGQACAVIKEREV